MYPWMSQRSSRKQVRPILYQVFLMGLRLPIPKLMNQLLKYWQKVAYQLTPNGYTYLSIFEALVSSKFATLTLKNVFQCFVFKPTIGKYFSINKKGVL